MTYNDKVVRQFTVVTILWGIVGMLVGVVIAAQLWLPALNFDIPWLTYGRLRPLHTNAVIFAFGGSALIGCDQHRVSNDIICTKTKYRQMPDTPLDAVQLALRRIAIDK